ncbi:MAG: spermine synthase [Chloroflexota bacterium]
MIVLSHFQVQQLNPPPDSKAIKQIVSPDLSLTQLEVSLSKDGVAFPCENYLSWDDVERIKQDENACFRLDADGIHKIQEFSNRSNRYYSLRSTSSAPTMLISGIPMHRIKDTNPWEDTHQKIKALGSIKGTLLDTTTGLGYTAIAASKTASWVMSIEIEPAVLTLCRQNPWSLALFNSPNISLALGDCYDIIESLPDHSFDQILHDPPTFSLAGDLYSNAFYSELFRVLAPNSKLFHYIGNPNSKTGARVTRGVIQRLKQAGFMRITLKPAAFGLRAFKS